MKNFFKRRQRRIMFGVLSCMSIVAITLPSPALAQMNTTPALVEASVFAGAMLGGIYALEKHKAKMDKIEEAEHQADIEKYWPPSPKEAAKSRLQAEQEKAVQDLKDKQAAEKQALAEQEMTAEVKEKMTIELEQEHVKQMQDLQEQHANANADLDAQHEQGQSSFLDEE